jgi:hypothetical protein
VPLKVQVKPIAVLVTALLLLDPSRVVGDDKVSKPPSTDCSGLVSV